jgi:hypothetical protein
LSGWPFGSALQVARSALQLSTPSGSVPPSSAASSAPVCSVMNAWIAASSAFDGHIPPPVVSACAHFEEYEVSHLLKSGTTPVFAAFASAFSRQKSYFPAVPSLLASHLTAGESASALAADQNTPEATNRASKCCLVLMIASLAVSGQLIGTQQSPVATAPSP